MLNKLFTYKYRPHNMTVCILPTEFKEKFNEYIKINNIPNLLFSGSAGTGKTTVSKILINELDCEHLEFNGSNGTLNIETLRELGDFTSCVSLSGAKLKLIFIDECDGLTKAVQQGLRNFMEQHDDVRFILTCNYPDKVIPALHSRCATFDFNIPKNKTNELAQDFARLCLNILNIEKVNNDPNDIIKLVKKYYPDQRRILNELQKNITSQKLSLGSEQGSDIKDLFTILQNKNFVKIKQWVADCNIDSVYSECYNNVEKYLQGEKLIQFVVSIAEAQKFDSSVPNRELNLLSALVGIMND